VVEQLYPEPIHCSLEGPEESDERTYSTGNNHQTK
jgi:hypothetical protein